MTSRAFTGGWLVGAVLLSTWAVSSASDQALALPAPLRPGAPLALPPASADLASQIARLETWTAAHTASAEPKRNPFKFEARSSKADVRPAPMAPAAASESTSNVELPTSNVPPPAPSLSAVATVSGVLTAVVSLDDTLHYVKKDEVIAGRYRVDSVTADAVEIFDLTLGTILRLTLRTMT